MKNGRRAATRVASLARVLGFNHAAAGAQVARATAPRITSASANLKARPPLLYIRGENLGPAAPKVWLGTTSLSVISSRPDLVVASLENFCRHVADSAPYSCPAGTFNGTVELYGLHWMRLGFHIALAAPGGVKAVMHAGSEADVAHQLDVGMANASWERPLFWNWSTNPRYGGEYLTVTSEDKIAVTVGGNAHMHDPAATAPAKIGGTIAPSYRRIEDTPVETWPGTFGLPPSSGMSTFFMSSTGDYEQGHVSSSYVFTGLSGTFQFSLCIWRNPSPNFADLRLYAPKVDVVVY